MSSDGCWYGREYVTKELVWSDLNPLGWPNTETNHSRHLRIIILHVFIHIYPPPCRRHSCVYNVYTGPCIQSSSLPVLQSSSFQIQFQLESESGVGVWRPILENPFLGGCRGAGRGRPRGLLPPWRSSRRLSSPILPRLGAPVRHLGTKMPQQLPRHPKNTMSQHLPT